MVSEQYEVSTCLSMNMCQDFFNFEQSEQIKGIFKSHPNGGRLPDEVRNVFKTETLQTHNTYDGQQNTI